MLAASCPPSSFDAVEMDDLFVLSVFASRNPDHRSAHIPQTLGLTFGYTGQTLDQVYRVFEENKHSFTLNDKFQHFSTAKKIRTQLQRIKLSPAVHLDYSATNHGFRV